MQFAQPLTEADHLLRRLRLILLLIALGGIALAALLGRLVARRGRRSRRAPHARGRARRAHAGPLERIASTAPSRSATPMRSGASRSSFNAMLDALGRSMSALDASVHAQRQLVADASHELRTPVTSLRTNIEILQQAHDIDPAEREQLFAEVVEQIEELTLLVSDLIDLARGEEPPADTEDVRLDRSCVRPSSAPAGTRAGWAPTRR